MHLKADLSSAIAEYIDALNVEMPTILAKASHYASKEMADRQKEVAPIDTTALRSSIHTMPEKKDGWKVVSATMAGVHYAFYQEYGTGSKGDAKTFEGETIHHTDKKHWMYTDYKGETHYGWPMEGRHFMRDGFDAEIMGRQIADFITEELNS